MRKVIIIDDEPLAVNIVKEFLNAHGDFEICGVAYNGFEGVKLVEEHQPDLIFLDVQMPKITGLEMLELLDHPPAVIFTTAYEEHAVKAFEADAIDYLLKPFTKDRFEEALDRFRKRDAKEHNYEAIANQQDLNRIVLRDQGQIEIIPNTEISHLESDDDYVKIHTANKSYMKKATLSSYEARLPADSFIRVHRSYLVNASFITRIDPYEKAGHRAVLKTGVRVPVSKSGYQTLKSRLGI